MNTEKQVDYIVQVVDYHQREQAKQEILALINQEKREMIEEIEKKLYIREVDAEDNQRVINYGLTATDWQQLRTKLNEMK